jgi:hypothetical protein
MIREHNVENLSIGGVALSDADNYFWLIGEDYALLDTLTVTG